MFFSLWLREGPLEKLWGGGGGASKVQKYSCNGKLSEKIHTQRVAQKKSSCIRKKYIFLQGKCQQKIRAAGKSPPPNTSITFLMVRP